MLGSLPLLLDDDVAGVRSVVVDAVELGPSQGQRLTLTSVGTGDAEEDSIVVGVAWPSDSRARTATSWASIFLKEGWLLLTCWKNDMLWNVVGEMISYTGDVYPLRVRKKL